MAVTPQAAQASTVTTGGTSVQTFPGSIGGGFIQNPLDAADQGISPDPAEPLYVDPTGQSLLAGPGNGNGTVFVLQPGQTWPAIAGQSTATRVNAETSGHKFSAVYWLPPSLA